MTIYDLPLIEKVIIGGLMLAAFGLGQLFGALRMIRLRDRTWVEWLTKGRIPTSRRRE